MFIDYITHRRVHQGPCGKVERGLVWNYRSTGARGGHSTRRITWPLAQVVNSQDQRQAAKGGLFRESIIGENTPRFLRRIPERNVVGIAISEFGRIPNQRKFRGNHILEF